MIAHLYKIPSTFRNVPDAVKSYICLMASALRIPSMARALSSRKLAR